jgi:hypothetical protein
MTLWSADDHVPDNARAAAGGLHLAIWVSGLAGLAAVPVAASLMRRHRKAPAATAIELKSP